jgi:hypothetical protein
MTSQNMPMVTIIPNRGDKAIDQPIPPIDKTKPRNNACRGEMDCTGNGRLHVRLITASISRSYHIFNTVLPLMARNKLPATAIMSMVRECTCWTLKKPANPVVSKSNVCKLFISGRYRFRIERIDRLDSRKLPIKSSNLTTLIFLTFSLLRAAFSFRVQNL